MSLIVIGGGIAGTAAVYRAVTSGRQCLWIQAGLGATAASSGALDWDPFDAVEGGASRPKTSDALSSELVRFGRELFDWQLPEPGVRVVTPMGELRPALGADAGVLDLNALGPGLLAVLDPQRLGWDAARVCTALNQHAWVMGKELRAVPLRLDRVAVAPAAPDVLFARALLGAPNFTSALASALGRLRSEGASPRAVLAGPWLFADNASVQTLRSAPAFSELGIAVGETLSAPYGIAGLRFEASRARWAKDCAGLSVVQARAIRVERLAGSYRVFVTNRAGAWEHAQQFEAETCVLALGGASSGTLQLDAGHQLCLGIDVVPAPNLQHRGRPWLRPAAETGVDLQALGMAALLELGLPAHLDQGRLRVVGDLVADQPRSVLRAAQSGLDAVS